MANYVVQDRATGEVVHAYGADQPRRLICAERRSSSVFLRAKGGHHAVTKEVTA